jgi:ADP-ribose pyrophosphatase YjhB (NUDIX family)
VKSASHLDARITVSAVIEADALFLTVVELDRGREVYSQPSGHLEHGESLIAGVEREVREETGFHCRPLAVIGIYLLTRPGRSTILRVCFHCEAVGDSDGPLDPEILRTHWLSEAELRSVAQRGPLVSRCLDDYLAGHRHPLGLIDHLVLGT